jgi:hypothetical protein
MIVGQKVRVFGISNEWIIGQVKKIDEDFVVVSIDAWLGVKPGEYRVHYSSLEIILSSFR